MNGDDGLPLGAAYGMWCEAIAQAAIPLAHNEDAAVVRIVPSWTDGGPYVAITARGSDVEQRFPLLDRIGPDGRRGLRKLRRRGEPNPQILAESLQSWVKAPLWPDGAVIIAPEPEPPPGPLSAGDRGELEALLVEHDLPASLADQAQWGIALLEDGTGRSRLGGPPDLAQWPMNGDVPLTHLASIALEELPDVAGRDVLPAAGTLVFCASFVDEDLLDGSTSAADPRVLVRHLPPGAEAGPAAPPPELAHGYHVPPLLEERRVQFAPVLTLPQQPDGIDEDDPRWDGLYWRFAPPSHLLLGHPGVVQWDPREPGELSVLHLGWDEALGFELFDGGDLTFHGSPEDVRAGRWDRLTVTPNSA